MPFKLAVKMAERNKGGATQPAALTELRMHSLCSFSWWEKYLAVRVLCWDNSIFWLDTFYERTPHSRFLGWKAAVLGKMNKIDLAKEALDKFLQERSEIKTISDYEKVAPTIIKDVLIEGLKLAGLPE